MRRPQIIVFERDGRLARMLDDLASDKKWVVREARQVDATLRLASAQAPSLVVIRLSAVATSELTMLTRCSEMTPRVATIVVLEPDATTSLTGLAWDLGADFVFEASVGLSRLPAVVEGLMSQG